MINTDKQFFNNSIDSCAPFEVKFDEKATCSMDNRSHKNYIKKKYILSHEYKSIEDEAAKLRKETVYKQMVIGKLIKGEERIP